MKILFTMPDDYSLFKNSLKNLLHKRPRITIPVNGLKQAAVNIILINKNQEPHVILTKRTHTVSTHKGQISFPGGMRDAADKDLLHTALRETEEEIGINASHNETIGIFDDYISIHDVHVATIVSSIEYPYTYSINNDEIEESIEAPLALFINQEYDELRMINFKGAERELYFYHYAGHEIWGLTARILTDLGMAIKNQMLWRGASPELP